MFEKLLQYFYFAQKTAGWILNCHDDGDKQTQKFLGCVLPQGTRILFLSCGSNFIVSLTSATPSVLVLPTPVWPCPRLCQRGEPKTRIRQLVQLSWSPGGSQHGPLGGHAHVLLQHLRWVCLLLIALDISWHGCVCQLASKFLAFSFNISSSRLFIHGPWMRCTLMADIAFTLLVILPPSSPCFDVEQNDLNSQQLPDQLLFVTNCMKETFRFKHNYVTKNGKAKAWQCKIRHGLHALKRPPHDLCRKMDFFSIFFYHVCL